MQSSSNHIFNKACKACGSVGAIHLVQSRVGLLYRCSRCNEWLDASPEEIEAGVLARKADAENG